MKAVPQHQRHESHIASGATNSTLALASVQPGNAGNYQIIVANAYGSTTSAVVSLTVLAAPVFQHVNRAGGAVSLTWAAIRGRSYQVQYKTKLSQSNWNNLGTPVTATGSTATATDAMASDAQRFYRVALLP